MVPIAQFFGRQEATASSYNFTYYEDLFAEDRQAPTPVNVLAKSYRNVQLHNPGTYKLLFKYNNGMTTEATWEVKELCDAKAKNLLLFIGDGSESNIPGLRLDANSPVASSMISAARLLAHKTINGKYQSKMMMDEA